MKKSIEKAAFLACIAVAMAATHVYTVFYTPASNVPGMKTIHVQKGASFRLVADGLEKAGVIRDAASISLLAGVLGAYKKIQAGEYELGPTMRPAEILDIIVSGRVKTYGLTIPEGYNINDIAAELERKGLAASAEFRKRAFDKTFAAELGFDGSSLEGYLFPDTYSFAKGVSVDDIILRMTARFRAVYKEFGPVAGEKAVSMKTIVTMASIIEKETGAPEERGLISAVFHNRLKKGVPLQSDPTVIYAVRDFDGNLTKRHLLTKTRYNTYINRGLPPGPIANPGRESIRAALNPADADYLYFVSKNDGTHHFSRTLKEHNDAVNMYQKQRRVLAEGRKKAG